VLGDVIQLKVPSGNVVNLKEIIPITGFDLQLDYAQYDCNQNTLTISMSMAGKTTVIPSFMLIEKVSAVLEADLTDIAQTLSITLQGIWKVGSLSIDVTLMYSRSTGDTSVTATPDSTTTIQSFIKSVLGLSLPINPSVNVPFQFRGDIASDGFTTLSLISDKGTNKYYGIYQKQKDSSTSTKGIATQIQNIQLSTAIKNVINFDISGAPYFGSLSVSNLNLTYATGLITDLDQGDLKESSLLQTLEYQIENGLTAYVNAPFHSDALKLTYHNLTLMLTTPKENLRLDNVLSSVASGDDDWKMKLPSQLQNIFSIHIESITLTADKLTINLVYPGELVFASGILSLSDVRVAVVVAKSAPKTIVNVFGTVKIGGVSFVTQLVQNEQGNYVLTASANSLEIRSYINSFAGHCFTRFCQQLYE